MKKGPPPSGAGPFFVCHGRVPDDRPGSLPVGGSEQDEAGAGDSKSPDHDWFSLPSDSGEVARVSDDNFYIGGRLAARVSARGYLVKNSPSARLVEAIEAVYEGRLCYPAELTELVLKEVARRSEDLDEEDESPGLSTRERQVVALVAAGFSNREIADHQTLSVRTIETHRQHVMDKLDIHSVAGLTKYAIAEGLTHLG